jgi:catechol 2,3-dioxygenase-like lactoylglutathione lyase family enzyme
VTSKGKSGTDVPRVFRLNLEVNDLEAAASFYGTLLGAVGRKQAGARCYFDCGDVTLQVLDVSSHGGPAHPLPKALYFTVEDLDAVHARAKSLGCLSREDVHGAPAGEIAVRPWGERSFYVEDPWQNPLCFVAEGTVYAG